MNKRQVHYIVCIGLFSGAALCEYSGLALALCYPVVMFLTSLCVRFDDE